VLDRTSGTPISAQPFVRNLNWSTGLDNNFRPVVSPSADYVRGPKMILPSNYGAHEWTPMAFSPLTGLVYIPVIDLPGIYVDLARNQAPRCTRSMRRSRAGYRVRRLELEYGRATGVFRGAAGFSQPRSQDGPVVVEKPYRSVDPIAQRAVWQRETARTTSF